MTLTLTLDRVILHTVVHHSSTSTYVPNFIEIEQTFCGRTDGRKHGRTDGRAFEIHFIRSTQKSRHRLRRVDLKGTFAQPYNAAILISEKERTRRTDSEIFQASQRDRATPYNLRKCETTSDNHRGYG